MGDNSPIGPLPTIQSIDKDTGADKVVDRFDGFFGLFGENKSLFVQTYMILVPITFPDFFHGFDETNVASVEMDTEE